MLSLLPLLKTQQDLLSLPRGRKRFERYLEVMIGGTGDIVLPLPGFNPMAKKHAAEVVDSLIDMEAETQTATLLREVEARLPPLVSNFRAALVVFDDLKGGWTNRYTVEMGLRFKPEAEIKRNWIVVPFWTSETQTLETVRVRVTEAIYRRAFHLRHGAAFDLQAKMTQEGLAAVFSGANDPCLDLEDLEYTREVIAPHLDSIEYPTVFSCLWGDSAAKSLGYTPLGLSDRAGFARARVNALEAGRSPESTLSSVS